MSLRIAFDMDGVLADMYAALGDEAERLFGETPSADPPRPRNRLTTREERRLWERVESIENFWESLAEIEPGVVARLHALAAERRWEVVFLTKRPATATRTTP